MKAVRAYPPGTRNRWETMADYINTRVKSGNGVTPDDVLHKVKERQNTGVCLSFGSVFLSPSVSVHCV